MLNTEERNKLAKIFNTITEETQASKDYSELIELKTILWLLDTVVKLDTVNGEILDKLNEANERIIQMKKTQRLLES